MEHIDDDLLAMQEMRNAVIAAKQAQSVFEAFSQEEVDRVVKAMSEAAFEQSAYLGKMAVEETGLGIAEHKKIKNEFAARDVYESIKDLQTVGIIREDKAKAILEVANPFGVIAGIVPTTNPTSTAIFKSLIALKARNAIVFSPHPSAAGCTVHAARICYEAALSAGAPKGIIGWIQTPTIETTEALMRHPDVNLILSTGGSGLVKAAYSSGKPAYGVGPGNVPAYIERTADVRKSVHDILLSKTFDNGTICASEQAIIVDQSIKQMAVRELRNQGAYFLSGSEKSAMEKLISITAGKLNPKIVGRSAKVIAEMAGISVPDETKVLIAEETEVGGHIPFSIEKLSPIFALYTVQNWEEGCKVSIALLQLGGLGHTLVIHSRDEKVIREFALYKPVSRILVNTPAAFGSIGATTSLKPSMTLGCGTFGGNITSDNLAPEHLMNVKRLAYGTRELSIPAVKTEHRLHADALTLRMDSSSIEEVVQEIVSRHNHGKRTIHPDEIGQIVEEVTKKLGGMHNVSRINGTRHD
jgi:acetaldehyde dehydrogenase (acetylating)